MVSNANIIDLKKMVTLYVSSVLYQEYQMQAKKTGKNKVCYNNGECITDMQKEK